MEPVVLIQVGLLPNGQIQCHAQGPLSVLTIRGLLGEAQDILLAKLKEQQKKPGLITEAPVGINGKG